MVRSSLKRVLVCGGRDYADYYRLAEFLDNLCAERGWVTEPDEFGNHLPMVHIISGMARGADTLAIDWAVTRYCSWSEYPADWKRHGNKAGPIRNQYMLDHGKPDIVVAFPGGVGTRDMISRAKKSGVELVEVAKEKNN
jgi:hypothetical protein